MMSYSTMRDSGLWGRDLELAVLTHAYLRGFTPEEAYAHIYRVGRADPKWDALLAEHGAFGLTEDDLTLPIIAEGANLLVDASVDYLADTLTTEEFIEIRAEEAAHEDFLVAVNTMLEEAKTEEAFKHALEAAMKGMSIHLGGTPDEVFIDHRGDISWEAGEFEWTYEMSGGGFLGIDGHLRNERFGVEPYSAFALGTYTR